MADGFQNSPDLTASTMTRRSFSVAELDAMFDAQILSRDEKLELIDGDLFKMNSQMMPHGVLKSRIFKALVKSLADHLEVSSEMTVQLNGKSLVDPDVLVTSTLSLERRYVQASELFLAIEVADTSLAYDTGAKAASYASAGVPELWVVDINGGQTWVHREPNATAYGSVISVLFAQALVPVVDQSVGVVIKSLLT